MSKSILACWHFREVERDGVARVLVDYDQRQFVGFGGASVDTEQVRVEAIDVDLETDVTEVDTVTICRVYHYSV